ncbi:EamA family transporter [Spirillospora albida]|uniref:EamA family transporter n=1 Tax=Spirillospora albida TaxID=58123 RepID=UPI0004C09638|nr:EamA family transporter [Spirillospora albida]
MVTVLALAAALSYGVADFLGGAVARRSTALKALTWCVPTGLVLVLAAALLIGGTPGAAGSAWGFAAGVTGGTGLITFYRALARGPMSVVAPVSALAAAILPIAVGTMRGERLDALVMVGVLLCLVAIGLVSMEEGAPDGTAPAPTGRRRLLDSGPVMAGVSGACFGVFFILLKEAGDGNGLWPLVAARAGNLAVVLVALALVARPGTDQGGPRVKGRALIALALLSGTLDAGANVLYFLAVHSGMLSLAAVLTSLYPAITVLLARLTYGERLRVVQQVGMAVAVAGVALVTAG